MAALTETTWKGGRSEAPARPRVGAAFILETDRHPMARHTRWRRDAGLAATDAVSARSQGRDAGAPARELLPLPFPLGGDSGTELRSRQLSHVVRRRLRDGVA